MKFFDNIPDPADIPRITKRTPKAKVVPKVTEGRGCQVCPLRNVWGTISTPKMPTYGGQRADVLVLGSHPTEQCDVKGRPQQGPGGSLFMRAVPAQSLSRLAYQNLVRCHGYGKAPNPQEIHACSTHLEADLEQMDIKAIIGIGQHVLYRFFPDAKVAQVWKLHGLRMVVEINSRKYWYLPVNDMQDYLDQGRDRNPEWDAEFTVLKVELREFLQSVDRLPKAKVTRFDKGCVVFVNSFAEGKELLDQMSLPIGLDLETNTLKPYSIGAKILTVGFSDGKTTFAAPVSHREAPNAWGLELLRYAVTTYAWVGHSTSMEYLWLRWTFPDAEIQPFEDSRACARLYFERKEGTSLAAVTRIALGTNIKDLSDLETTRLDEYPVEEVLVYNGLDALGSRLAYDALRPKVEDSNYIRIMESVETTVEMEVMGLHVSQENVANLRTAWLKRMRDAEASAYQIFEVKAWQANTGREFNVGSNQQLAEVLVDYAHMRLPQTGKGAYMTGEDILKEYAGEHPLTQAVLDFREAQKQIGTYIDACANVTQYQDGLLHPGYNTMSTHTLRLSSDEPNIQNFPSRRHRIIRSMIVPAPGYVLVPIDYGQLEARVIAMISRDRVLCDFIIRGEDIHSVWLNKLLERYPEYLERLAQKTNETDEAKIRKGGRNVIKTDFVFASFYGSTAASCARKTGVPIEIMEDVAAEFWRTFRGVKAWIDLQRANYKATGDIPTVTKRVRHAVVPGNEIINNPVQSVAADIVADSMNELSRLSRVRKDRHLHPRMQIHDDLTFMLPARDRDLERYIQEITEIMTKVRYPWQIVPLAVEVSICNDNWAEKQDLYTHVGNYVR